LTVVRYAQHNGHQHHHKHNHQQQHSSSTQSKVAAASIESLAAVSQDTLHALESAVITWTKQIKAVLKQVGTN
jgi:hypothetical protein